MHFSSVCVISDGLHLRFERRIFSDSDNAFWIFNASPNGLAVNPKFFSSLCVSQCVSRSLDRWPHCGSVRRTRTQRSFAVRSLCLCFNWIKLWRLLLLQIINSLENNNNNNKNVLLKLKFVSTKSLHDICLSGCAPELWSGLTARPTVWPEIGCPVSARRVHTWTGLPANRPTNPIRQKSRH